MQIYFLSVKYDRNNIIEKLKCQSHKLFLTVPIEKILFFRRTHFQVFCSNILKDGIKYLRFSNSFFYAALPKIFYVKYKISENSPSLCFLYPLKIISAGLILII